jgi:imidazolonepropionase
MTAPAHFPLLHAAELATLAEGSVPRRGSALDNSGTIADGSVAAAGGRIIAVGPTDAVLCRVEREPATTVVEAHGQLVTPGLVDSHTPNSPCISARTWRTP